jgi:hypothetical protein
MAWTRFFRRRWDEERSRELEAYLQIETDENIAFARRYFGGRSPLGERFGFGNLPGTKTYIEIVGVIKGAKYSSLRDASPPQTIVDYEQMDGAVFQATIYVKTRIDPRQMYSSIRRAVQDVDRDLPFYEMRTLDEQRDMLLATVLAAIGLYGLMAFNVAERTQEIGIRMALGARDGNVAWLVMKEVLSLVAAGAAVALPASWILTRFVRSQLYDIGPNDPQTIVAAMFVLTIVAAMAGYIPARRAARIDPIRALRYE